MHDSLAYAKRLIKSGIPERQAMAHAEAFRDCVVPFLPENPDSPLTKSGLAKGLQKMERVLVFRLALMFAFSSLLVLMIKVVA